MNDLQNWRVSNSWISSNLPKNHRHVILSPNYAHSVSSNDVNFAQLVIANQSILWNSLIFWSIFKFPDFSCQFSNSLTFPSSLVFQLAWHPCRMRNDISEFGCTARLHPCINRFNGKWRSENSERNKSVTFLFLLQTDIMSHYWLTK